MNPIDLASHGRRAFLARMAQLAVAGAATPLGLNLAAMGEAAAFTGSGYKALVCVFLYGGNDYANTVVTYDDPSWNAYRSIRTAGPGPAGLAIEKSALGATLLSPTTALPDGRQYALHPAMGGLAALFNAGQAAALLNVGPLVKPTTLSDYYSPDRVQHPLPPQLLSHNDQQSVWQRPGRRGRDRRLGRRHGRHRAGQQLPVPLHLHFRHRQRRLPLRPQRDPVPAQRRRGHPLSRRPRRPVRAAGAGARDRADDRAADPGAQPCARERVHPSHEAVDRRRAADHRCARRSDLGDGPSRRATASRSS